MKAENRDFVRSSGVLMTGAARALVFGKRGSSLGDGSAATVAKCTHSWPQISAARRKYGHRHSFPRTPPPARETSKRCDRRADDRGDVRGGRRGPRR
jgi:hypothetical protein